MQGLIESNTATEIIVCGDVTGYASSGDTYKIIDYYLRDAMSAAIDVGTATNAPGNDIEGTVRPIDIPGVGGEGTDSFDIGAYEYQLPLPMPPSNPDATAIGPDTITWTWQDNSDNEDGFKVWADPGAAEPTTLRVTTPPDTESWVYSGLTPNTEHAFQVAATNAAGDSAKTPNFTAWTRAAVPLAPVVNNPTGSSLDVSIGAGDGNPAQTEYALHCVTAGLWVQDDGTLGASALWQTAAAWDTVTVTGLSEYAEHAFTAAVRNGAGVETASGPAGAAWTLDVTPPTGTILVNGSAAYTNTTAVTLELSASDAGSGVADMRFSNDGLTWSGWEPYAASKAWTLASGDGLKTVYAQYRDHTNNVSTGPITDNITLDTIPPTGTIIINGGAAYTNTTAVTLELLASDTGVGVADMRFSNNGADWSSWEAYAASTAWTLEPGDGLKTVHVQYRDHANNVSTTPITDSITLDTIPPTGTILINGGAAYTNATAVTLALSASDTGSGVADMRFSNNDADWSGWEPYAASKAWTLEPGDGLKTVHVQYRDHAGNVSTDPINDTITLDTVTLPLTITQHPQGGQKSIGDSHEFVVVVTGGYPPLSYQWRKNEAVILDAPDASVYVLAGLEASDSGSYTVVVTDNNGAFVESEPAVLVVGYGLPIANLAVLVALISALLLAMLGVSKK